MQGGRASRHEGKERRVASSCQIEEVKTEDAAPSMGDQVDAGSVCLRVETMDELRIARIKLIRKQPPGEECGAVG